MAVSRDVRVSHPEPERPRKNAHSRRALADRPLSHRPADRPSLTVAAGHPSLTVMAGRVSRRSTHERRGENDRNIPGHDGQAQLPVSVTAKLL
jgi:hypothetical protein